MDLGTGIAIVGIAIPAGALGITALKTRANGNGDSNGNGKQCSLHSGIEATLTYLKDGQKRIEEKLDKVLGGE